MEKYKSKRLLMAELTLEDTDFIFKLVNTPDWIEFIGDRNIKTRNDAVLYVQRLMDNLNVNYWIVKLEKENIPIGIITFIKREYLDHHDIGFAFLPAFKKQGYAHEAAETILFEMIKGRHHPIVLATTTKENESAIRLLQKIGFVFGKELKVESKNFLLYAISEDKVYVGNLVRDFFEIFNNAHKNQSEWALVNKLFTTETVFIKKCGTIDTVYNVHTFLEAGRKLLLNGVFVEFEENETSAETKIERYTAKRFSRYQRKVYVNGKSFNEFGNKLFEFNRTDSGWKIVSLTWRDDII